MWGAELEFVIEFDGEGDEGLRKKCGERQSFGHERMIAGFASIVANEAQNLTRRGAATTGSFRAC